ncbi:hypothetical protein CGRA01v4_08259 [Colletotrichum graminicola]|nr:hypothetical protein CGRA01v4_08259 [Colletotrichum graminicola]
MRPLAGSRMMKRAWPGLAWPGVWVAVIRDVMIWDDPRAGDKNNSRRRLFSFEYSVAANITHH